MVSQHIEYINLENTKNKIIHLSDIHIRTGNYDRSRYDEYMIVFVNLINSLKKIEDFSKYIIVITGDIFHNKSQIESSGISLFTYLISELTKLTSVFLIMGNHDYRQEYINEPDLLSALLNTNELTNIKSNLYYLKKTGIYIIGDILFGLVAINDTLIPGNTSGKVENLPQFPDVTKFDNKYKIALYHGIIIDDNDTFFKNKNIGISVNWFKSYDFAILGDIHSQQVRNSIWNKDHYDYDNKKIVWGYSGSLVQQNFGESINKHGYLIWDFENKQVIPYQINNSFAYCTLKYTDDWYIKKGTKIKSFVLFTDFLNEYSHLKNL
jgi:DNA repair exonuclease SbcCD nuclease subunit